MKVLLVLRSFPYENSRVQETVELALTLLALEQQVDMLVLGKGILQLVVSQEASSLGARAIPPLLDMVKWYGLGQLWIDQEALKFVRSRGKRLLLEGNEVTQAQMAGLVRGYDLVLWA